MLVVAMYGTRRAARLAMSNDQNLPDKDTNDKDFDVFLVVVTSPDGRRRLAAAIELLLRAGARHADNNSEEDEQRGDGDVD